MLEEWQHVNKAGHIQIIFRFPSTLSNLLHDVMLYCIRTWLCDLVLCAHDKLKPVLEN